MAVLRLGVTDRGFKPTPSTSLFDDFHEPGMNKQFREEANDSWKPFAERDGGGVKMLQTRLRALGFMPNGEVNGIFDYRTQSASRLFQEYVRSVEGVATIGTPDARVGPKTIEHMQRWESAGSTADWTTRSSPTASAHATWFRLLEKIKTRAAREPGPILHRVDELWQAASASSRPDTLPVSEWDYSPDDVHLVGVRRGATSDWKTRINNDLLVLLVRGMVFTFFGSTDPSPNMTSAPPFLVPGQHLYRFGWHMISKPFKCYRAFRPRNRGVLVMRDRDNKRHQANLSDQRVLARAIESTPNSTINIHWSGRHTTSWSAGCQVVSGGGYINHHDELVDCWDHSSVNYGGLATATRGAYNVLLDLITVFTEDSRVQGGDLLRYTLINERDLALEAGLGASLARDTLKRGLRILEVHDRTRFREYADALA